MRTRILLLVAMTMVGPAVFAAPVSWSKDFKGALATARKTGKIVFLAFEAKWCSWCKRLDEGTYVDPRVAARMRKEFVAVKLDAERNGKELASIYNVVEYPTTLLIDGNGDVVGTIAGYQDPASFLIALDRFDTARRDWPMVRQRLQKNPADLEANARAAAIYASKGMREQSELALRKAEAGNHTSRYMVDAYLAVGDNFQSAEQFDAAIRCFKKADALAKDPKSKSYARMSTMYCLLGQDKREAAVKVAKTIVVMAGAEPQWIRSARGVLARAAAQPQVGRPVRPQIGLDGPRGL
jgi:thioredoxin-related protein